MKIEINRTTKTPAATIGEMSINGKFQCYTLEDTYREVVGQPIHTWKINSKTAIPAGTYNIIITMSPRFKKLLPRLENVAGFSGVLIHPGNTSEDTEGCILVGTSKTKDFVGGSQAAFKKLFPLIEKALVNKEKVTLVIK